MLSFGQIKNSSLQICRHQFFQIKANRKRVLLLAVPLRRKAKVQTGSLTIEAALVLPMFLFALISLLSLLSLLLFYMKLQGALHQQARYMAEQAYISWDFTVEEIQTAVLERIGENKLSRAPVKGSAAGFSFAQTDLSDREFVKLSVSYEAELPYDFFDLFSYSFTQTCFMHSWIGFEKGLAGQGQSSIEEYVYITETGEVYHRDRECSHIRLNIQETSADELNSLRNSSGGKYHSCEHCNASLAGGSLYITEDGDRYHNSLSCSGLKRTVIAIPLSEAGNRRPCSGCGKRHFN